MIVPKHTTSLKTKEANIEKFIELLKDQLLYGGTKYQLNDNKECTDVVTECVGVEWILGTCIKYLLRFKNLRREKDLLKIASYMFICWLQVGFHENETHDTDTGEKK